MARQDGQYDKLWETMLSRSFSPAQWFEGYDGYLDYDELSDLDGQEGKIMWVYRKLQEGNFSVGYYTPDKEWVEDRQVSSREAASDRVHWLNGGG